MTVTIYHLLDGRGVHLLSSCLAPEILVSRPEWDIQHRVLIWGGDKARITDHLAREQLSFMDRCEFVPRGLQHLVRRLSLIARDPARLIIHGVYHRFFWFALRLSPRLLARTCWISWGGGILSAWRHYPIGLNPVRYLWFKPFRYCVPRLAAVSCQNQEEFDRLETMVGSLNNRCDARYLLQGLPQVFCRRMHKPPLKVCVGHRALDVKEYESVFNMLARFAAHPLEVHVPLSYGNMQAVEGAKELGQRILGDSFRPLTKLMCLADYSDFLRDMDVLVLPQPSAGGGFNTTFSLAAGCKVFLHPENSILNRTREDGCTLFELSSLGNMRYAELAEPLPEPTQRANYDALRKRNDAVARAWTQLYAQIVTPKES